MGYQTANLAYEDDEENYNTTADALEQLANATAADRSAVANLIEANSTLTKQFESVRDLKTAIETLCKEMKEIKVQVGKLATGKKVPVIAPTREKVENQQSRRQNKWCWTCGVNKGHFSNGCKWPMDGHCKDATSEKMMGSTPFGMKFK